MKLKKDVNVDGVEREVWFALGVADAIYSAHGMELVVTSLNDGHADKPTSLHSKDGRGRACDCRTRNVPISTAEIIFNELVAILNPLGFDVVFHRPDGPVPQHIHIESDAKPGEEFLKREA
jgi:hypothetical protein